MALLNFIKVAFEPVRTAAFGAITANYTALGGNYDHAIRIIAIINNTDAAVNISFNGVDNHIYVPSQVGLTFDFSSNRELPSDQFEQPIDTQVYIKHDGVAPTSGKVAVSTVYAIR